MMTALQLAQIAILVDAIGRVAVNRFVWRAAEFDDLRLALSIDFLYVSWLNARKCALSDGWLNDVAPYNLQKRKSA